VSNTVDINERIAAVIADLFTEGLQRNFRYGTPEQLGYTAEELSTVKQRIRETAFDSLCYPTAIDLETNTYPPFMRGYIHSKMSMSEPIERALYYIDGQRTIDKWWPLLPELQIHVENNRAYLIDGQLNWTWVGGEPEEANPIAADLNKDATEWSNHKEEDKVPLKVYQAKPAPALPRYRYNYYGAFLEIPASEVVFDCVTDLKYGMKFSLTQNGYVYTVVSVDHVGPGSWMKVTVNAKKWRKVLKSIQKVGKSHRTSKEIINLDNKTKVRTLDLAKDRRIYLK